MVCNSGFQIWAGFHRLAYMDFAIIALVCPMCFRCAAANTRILARAKLNVTGIQHIGSDVCGFLCGIHLV